MSRWQECHGDEDELENDRWAEREEREERRAEEKREQEWEDRRDHERNDARDLAAEREERLSAYDMVELAQDAAREKQRLQALFVGDECGYLAATAQAVIDAGNAHLLTPDEKECWLYKNTKNAAIRPVNFGEI